MGNILTMLLRKGEVLEFLSREEILNDYHRTLHSMMKKYDLDDIGIYEEEGPGNEYYFGYTIRKNGSVYIINLPYKKMKMENWQSKNISGPFKQTGMKRKGSERSTMYLRPSNGGFHNR
jgi:Family of unknown function (DUF5634)